MNVDAALFRMAGVVLVVLVSSVVVAAVTVVWIMVADLVRSMTGRGG